MHAEGLAVRRGLARRLAALGRPDARSLRRLAITGVGNGLSRALGLVFALVLAGLFLPAEYGYVRWATSVGMLAAIPVAGGPVALARALGAAEGDLARQRGLATVGLVAIVVVTAACAVVTALALAALGRPVGGALAVLVGMTLFTAAYNIYRGVGSAWRIAVLYAGSNALQLVLVVLLCGALGWKIPDLALIVYSFAWTLVVLALELRAPLDLAWDATSARGALAELWRVWAPLVLANAAYGGWAWGDVVLVEHYLGDAAAGYYGLARTIVTVFLLVPEAVTMLLLPLVAAQGRGAGKLTTSLLGLTAAVSVVLLGGMLLVGPPLLNTLGDGRYAPAAAALPGLAVGMALYALYLVLEGHLVGMGRAAVHAVGISVMLVVTLGGAALLLPSQGIAGGGLAFALGAAAGLATLVVLGRGALQGDGAPPPPPNAGGSSPPQPPNSGGDQSFQPPTVGGSRGERQAVGA
jgi:O-antigen/teichoic acid export membrane protein